MMLWRSVTMSLCLVVFDSISLNIAAFSSSSVTTTTIHKYNHNNLSSSTRLSFFSSLLRKNEADVIDSHSNSNNSNKVVEFYDAWNRRDMEAAAACFADDAVYDDTNFAKPLEGKEEIRNHFIRCADAFPVSFKFALDDMAVDSVNGKIGTRWHVEDVSPDGSSVKELPFTRGSSFYTINEESNLIDSGFDVVEPAILKPGDAGLTLLSIASKVIKEPVRAIPWLLWGAYMYTVFFSNGILPGANALALEQRTWEEVINLSINFFFVSPLLNLPFSPVVHPGLEGIFNLLLSWAALFGGFLSDEREDKKNIMPMLPTVIGMQFLTSAFLLPYLATRESEKVGEESRVLMKMENLNGVTQAFESKLVGPFLGFIGGFSIFWACFGRPEFGQLNERYLSLVDLLSIDRVGSSFIVDLIIFALFQGWLVDDDLRRRGVSDNEMIGVRSIAKYIPFFGMAAYLTVRPSFPNEEISEDIPA